MDDKSCWLMEILMESVVFWVWFWDSLVGVEMRIVVMVLVLVL